MSSLTTFWSIAQNFIPIFLKGHNLTRIDTLIKYVSAIFHEESLHVVSVPQLQQADNRTHKHKPNLFNNRTRYQKFLIYISKVVFYIILLFVTILCAFLTSTVCHAAFTKSCQSRVLHSTFSPCHQNSNCL